MARDKNAQERIESIIYTDAIARSGALAEAIYEQEVLPLIHHLENLLLAHAGVPINAIAFGQQVDAARIAVNEAKIKQAQVTDV